MQINYDELPDTYKLAIQSSRRNLIPFQIATNENYTANFHHDIIAKALEHIEAFGDRDYKVLLVFVPPRHGKSQQCSIDFPAWYLGRNPAKEVITASYSADLAQDFGAKTREKVNSENYRIIFPEVTLREDEQARGRWRTKQGGGYIAVGVGGSITGRGADILLIDDPIKNREEADSDVYREKVWNWFTSTAFTRLHPKGVAVVILTRWHVDDLAGRILENSHLKGRTKIINFPAIAQKYDHYRQEGQALWLERYNIAALDEIRQTIGPYDWQSLYQGSPVLNENQEFKPEWIRRIPEMQVEAMNTRRFLTVDTAMSKQTQADYTGFVDNRVNSENYWHIMAWRMKVGPEELVDMLFTLHNNHRYEAIGIEKTTYTQGLKPYLDAEQRRRRVFLPLFELSHNQTAKEIRVRGLIPRYASRSVFHIEGETKELEEEMYQFPHGLHDDIIDSLAYQLQLADNPSLAVGAQLQIYTPEYD